MCVHCALCLYVVCEDADVADCGTRYHCVYVNKLYEVINSSGAKCLKNVNKDLLW